MAESIPLVLKLQADAMNESVPVASLLRTAKAIAIKLDLEDALVWIDRELSGYEELTIEDLPTFRCLRGIPQGWNPYQGWESIQFSDAEHLKQFSTAPIGLAIGAIEDSLSNRSDSTQYEFPYPPKAKTVLLRSLEIPTDVRLMLNPGSIFNIVESVRNLVLSWSLDLEKAGILGEGMSFSVGEKTDAIPVSQRIFANNIGVVGNVGDNAHVASLQIAGIDIDGTRDLLVQVQSAMPMLPDTVRNNLEPIVAEVAQVVESDAPDEGKLRGLLMTVRNVCEGATGNVVAQGIIGLILKLLGG